MRLRVGCAPGTCSSLSCTGPARALTSLAVTISAGTIAIEWWPDDYAAIRNAVTRGILVIEAAGNGAENLDDAIYQAPAPGFPAGWTNPFRRSNRDSGAIVVGAGAPLPVRTGAAMARIAPAWISPISAPSSMRRAGAERSRPAATATSRAEATRISGTPTRSQERRAHRRSSSASLRRCRVWRGVGPTAADPGSIPQLPSHHRIGAAERAWTSGDATHRQPTEPAPAPSSQCAPLAKAKRSPRKW